MSDYKIQVRLVTEAIFGSGYSIPGSVDLEIVCDELGLPYMKAKTFKGNFRESMEEIVEIVGKEYEPVLYELMGKGEAGVEQWRTLKFSDMRLSENIRYTLEKAISEGELESQEIKEALTDVRSFTSIDVDGSSKQGSLRQIRVIKKNLVFEVEIHSERELSNEELGLLSMATRNLRHIGAMRTRGKGELECSFLDNQNGEYIDNTNKHIEEFVKGVKFGA